MKESKAFIIFLFSFAFLFSFFPLALALSTGLDDGVFGLDLIPTPPINSSLIPTVNSSDYWDDLDVPLSSWTDVCYNDSYVPYTNANQNIDIGTYNLTTTGRGQFSWIDFLEGSEPPTPPANTLSLYVVEQSGFSRINYKDEYGVTRTINDDEIIVNNSRGSTISAHRLVYVTGYNEGVPTVDLAMANDTNTMPSICVTIESIADAQLGRCMMSGLLENVNTNAFDVGLIYVSDITAGIPTNTPPLTPNLTQEIGSILVKSATVGKIQILARALTGDEFGTINNFTVASGSYYLGDGSFLTNLNALNLSGGNANQDIDIGTYDFEATIVSSDFTVTDHITLQNVQSVIYNQGGGTKMVISNGDDILISNPSNTYTFVGAGGFTTTSTFEINAGGDGVNIDTDLILDSSVPTLIFEDTGPSDDFKIYTDGSKWYLHNLDLATNILVVDSSHNLGIGPTDPIYPLEVNRNVSGISIWSQMNVSATGYNTRTSAFDKNKNVWDYIKDADEYLTNGKVDHNKFYGYAGGFEITDYSRPEIEKYIGERCDENLTGSHNITYELCEIIGDKIICNNITEIVDTYEKINCRKVIEERTIYPYTKVEKQVSLNMEVDLLRQGIYELKQENNLLKSELCLRDMTYSWCK